jgi:hypothetical protein
MARLLKQEIELMRQVCWPFSVSKAVFGRDGMRSRQLCREPGGAETGVR